MGYIRVTILILFCAASFAQCKKGQTAVVEKLTTMNYPSGSALAYVNNRIYLMGNDASSLLILDTGLNTIDSINFFSSPDGRISKDLKGSFEAAAVVSPGRKSGLLIIGPGSVAPQHNSCRIIELTNKQQQRISLDTFYKRLSDAGIKQLNIEGAAEMAGGIILANRGNNAYPKNQLIFTSLKFWQDQANAPISIANLGTTKKGDVFHGVSGLEYSRLTDKLLVTFSTENTSDTHTNGIIGKSYLWSVNDISSKKGYSGINPTKIIDLGSIDQRFANQKIESVCIISENNAASTLIFAADNDNGTTTLFRVKITN